MMPGFSIILCTPTQRELIPDVHSFRGRDAAGSFGILPNAYRRLTVIKSGLAQFKRTDQIVEYLALPDGVLDFKDKQLFLAVTKFYRSSSLEEISQLLEKNIQAESEQIQEIRRTLSRLDQGILKKLAQISQSFV
jgi:F-type H+-transporting ATPase subunit epsilon